MTSQNTDISTLHSPVVSSGPYESDPPNNNSYVDAMTNPDSNYYDERLCFQGSLVPDFTLVSSDYSVQSTEPHYSIPLSFVETGTPHTRPEMRVVMTQGTNLVSYQPLIDDHQHSQDMSMFHGHLIPSPDVDSPYPSFPVRPEQPPHNYPPSQHPPLQYPVVSVVMPTRLCICGCGREAVPMQPNRRRSDSDRNMPRELILFRTIEDQCGIKISDALAEIYTTLLDRDSFPFDRSRSRQGITVVITWPGYRRMNGRMRTIDWSRASRPTRLSKLASMISTLVVRFIRERQGDPYGGADPRWRVGANGIEADDFVLVGLEKISKGSWQPHFRLDNVE